MTDAERTRLEQRRDRIMKLIREGDSSELDSAEREDLVQEWHKIDQALNRR